MPVDAFGISVTTDGHVWSGEQLFVVYDSRCQRCDIQDQCRTKVCFLVRVHL